MARVCDHVRDARNQRNISQEYMASVIGIDTSSYHRLEKGNSPITIERLEKIAHALGVSLHELICGSNQPFPDLERNADYLHHLEKEVVFLRKQLQEKEYQLSMILESKLEQQRSATNPLR
jgi:transcriptional regulator with XRE-family HTH domain